MPRLRVCSHVTGGVASSTCNAPAARKKGHSTVKVRSAFTVGRFHFMPTDETKAAGEDKRKREKESTHDTDKQMQV